MKSPRRTHGFTMIEMLIVITIISIIGLIAMPVYNNYIATSREGVLVTNITTIEIFQEDFRLRNGAYAVDLANIAAITAAIGWDPQAVDGTTYVIADGDGTTYSVGDVDAASTRFEGTHSPVPADLRWRSARAPEGNHPP